MQLKALPIRRPIYTYLLYPKPRPVLPEVL